MKPIETETAIIGGGQAGVPLARVLAHAGHSVVLFEREHLGGSCVNFGCTPSKAIIASARLAADVKHGGAFGSCGRCADRLFRRHGTRAAAGE
jgi:pyruvate/2-oxoglutarate dehydrogenase complex dihydrolipoamide dehydrogenase (E3) component